MTFLHLKHSNRTSELLATLIRAGLSATATPAEDPKVVVISDLVPPRMLGQLREHPAIESVEVTGDQPTLCLRGEREEGTRSLTVAGRRLDFDRPCVMAGPCVVDDEETLDEIATRLSTVGVPILRGGGDKVRSSPYAFRGHGQAGYETLRRVASRHGMLTIAEVVDSDGLAPAAELLDLIQVGSRNMHNPHFLERIAALGKPVLLKRGFGATYLEWLCAGEYLLAGGAPFLLFCERGIRTFSPMRRFTLDVHAFPFLRDMTAFPVLADPSHAAGAAPYVPDLARAGLAAGAHGLLVECHPTPERARCDARQALTLDSLEALVRQVAPAATEPGTPNRVESLSSPTIQ